MTKTLIVELLPAYTSATLKAEVFNTAGVSQSTYTDSDFSAVDSNGVRVLTYTVPSITFEGTVVVSTSDDATRIGTSVIEVSTNDIYAIVSDATIGNQAIKNAIVGISPAGNGDTPIDHDFGGDDNYRITNTAGDGIDGVTITAYEQAAYNGGSRIVIAQTTTGSDGRWNAPLMLDSGTYVCIAAKPGEAQTTVFNIEV